MIIRVIVLKLLFLSSVESNSNLDDRTNMKAPELEINQQEYSNPSYAQELSKDLITAQNENLKNAFDRTESKDDVTEKTNKEKSSEVPNTVKDNNPPKHEIPYYEESMFHTTEIFDQEFPNEPAVFSVGTKNIPNFDRRKFMGPMRNPGREPPFQGTGPRGLEDSEKPSCNAFSRNVIFNPYSILDQKWFNFYRWDINTAPIVVEFFVPTTLELNNMRAFLDKQVKRPISWSSRIIVMVDHVVNISSLLVERSNHGQFWMYLIAPNASSEIEPQDVRMKQTSDNRLIALVLCESDRAYIFSRINEVPLKKDIADAVAALGWRGRDGRSYLYQGHKWLPIPELDEVNYWAPQKYRKKDYLSPPREHYDPDTDDTKIF